MCVLPLANFLVVASMLLLLLGGAPAGGTAVRLSDCLQDDDYDQLLQAVQTGLPPVNTSHHVVKRIIQSDEGVTVSYQKGQQLSVTDLQADAVAVTTTARAALFIDFVPSLSVLKMEALRPAHYIGLTFHKKFWEKDGIQGGKSVTNRSSRLIYYPSHSFPENQTVSVLLASYTWSDDSEIFSGASDEDIKELVLRDLEQIHGRQVWALCTGVLVKKWDLDPFSLSSPPTKCWSILRNSSGAKAGSTLLENTRRCLTPGWRLDEISHQSSYKHQQGGAAFTVS